MRLILSALFLFIPPSVWAMGHVSPQAVKSALIGKAAPDAVLPKTDGTTYSVTGQRQGKKAIVIFWATWCPNCYEELSTVNDRLVSIEAKGIRIILVDVGETKEAVKDYLNRRGMKLASFIDQDSVLQESYHLTGVPTLIFIDEKGIVQSVTHELTGV